MSIWRHAFEAVPEVLACGCEPTAVEFMEREVIACAETYLGKQFPDASSDAYLLVRLDGASPEALRPMVDRLTDVALELGAQDVLLADTDERKESIWNARGAFLEAIKGSTRKHGRMRRGGTPGPDRGICEAQREHRARGRGHGSARSDMRATATCTCTSARTDSRTRCGRMWWSA